LEEDIPASSSKFLRSEIMSCPNYKRLCKRLVISEAVTFADDTLTINIPEGNYNDCEKYCIVVA